MVSSTTNKTHKSFVFDFMNNGSQGKKKGHSQNKNGKRLLNLTGTIPKGVLSPTNNIKNNKHAHYFESAAEQPDHE